MGQANLASNTNTNQSILNEKRQPIFLHDIEELANHTHTLRNQSKEMECGVFGFFQKMYSLREIFDSHINMQTSVVYNILD